MDQNSFERLCQLARLELDPLEQVDFEHKFESLLEFVDKVQGWVAPEREPAVPQGQQLELRRDLPAAFEWPGGTVHTYRVPQVIDFEDAE